MPFRRTDNLHLRSKKRPALGFDRFRVVLCVFCLFVAFIAALSCASSPESKNTQDADVQYVGSSAAAPPPQSLPYHRLLRDDGPDDHVKVADILEIRRNSLGKLDPIGPVENGEDARIVVPQRNAWWLHAPQFKQPKLVRAGVPEEKIKVPLHCRGTETVVRVHLDEDGSVARMKIMRGVDERLDNLCRDMIGQSTFEPARWKGIPLRFTFLIPCRWNDSGEGE